MANSVEPQPQKLSLDHPPGGLLIWLFFGIEFVTFAILFVAIALQRRNHHEEFLIVRSHLSLEIGFLYTALLLTSGWMTAMSVDAFFKGREKRARLWHLSSLLFGLLFLVCKIADFRQKLTQGISLGLSDIWDMFFLSTGFHFIHILVGIGFMILIQAQWNDLRLSPLDGEKSDFSMRGSAAYWHFCDVLWLFLFSLFYL